MKTKRHSLKWRVMGMILLCWLIPIGLMIGVMGYYIMGNRFNNMVDSFQKQLEYGDKMCEERLNGAISASREASKHDVIRQAYYTFSSGGSAYRFTMESKAYLTDQYRQNEAFYNTIFWLVENPETYNCSVYNLQSKGNYQQIQDYWKNDHEAIKEFAEGLDTSVGFINMAGRVYMVRNLVDAKFRPYGVLVMRMNLDYCFGSLVNIPLKERVTLTLNDQDTFTDGAYLKAEELGIDISQEKEGYLWKNGDLYIYQTIKSRDYQFRTIMKMDSTVVNLPIYGYGFIILGMFLFLIPLLLLVVHAFKKQVSVPLENMMSGARELENGNMGYQLEETPVNLEFKYLYDSFNRISRRLKSQFERIYKEEIALRDARIMALQSQINPHFMNNTLEIINWEARLAGNLKVTKMIEALSTLMDAAMDRKKRTEVLLSEEMAYVNAYLYITKERLGKRLEIMKELPEDIMDCKVPRLILQPVIENAIEHGIVPQGNGKIIIRGRKDEFLTLEIENEGKLTPEDIRRIRSLLDPSYQTSDEKFENMGIANVNQRLRILYGAPCGLTIEKNGEDRVVARLIIKSSE